MIIKNINSTILGVLIICISLAVSFNTASAQQVDTTQTTQNTIEGTVLDASNGQALANVTVEIPRHNEKAQTDEQGKFSFENLDQATGTTGEITLVVNHDGYQKLSKTVRVESSKQINLELKPKNQLK